MEIRLCAQRGRRLLAFGSWRRDLRRDRRGATPPLCRDDPGNSHTRCARRSLVELTAAASRAVDDGLFVLSSGIAASNPRSEHTAGKTSDQPILARQATAPSPVAVLESRNAAAPRKDELLDSDTTTEMMVKIAKDYQNRAFENINASLNAALDHAKDLVETRVGGEAASKDIGGFSFLNKFFSVL